METKPKLGYVHSINTNLDKFRNLCYSLTITSGTVNKKRVETCNKTKANLLTQYIKVVYFCKCHTNAFLVDCTVMTQNSFAM